MTEVNGNNYIVSDAQTDSFSLKNSAGDYIDSTDFEYYQSGGEVRKMVSSVSGLTHLEGETVSVTADGSYLGTFTVSSGAITLSATLKYAVVHAGLPYTGRIDLLKLSDGSPTGGQTKNRRIYQLTLRVDKSWGMGKIGQDEDTLDDIDFGDPADSSMYSGDIDKNVESWWDKQAEIVIKVTQPLPLFLLNVVIRSEVEEKS